MENNNDVKNKGAETAGVVFGDVSNASTNYVIDKFNSPRGHGFAAERANHLFDILNGKDASIVGDDNAKNGADRVVNGVNIQSKYCASGSKCISECFDKQTGEFRYLNPDGTPMQIEVPSDKYDDAIRAMQERIKNGKIPGVTDPAKAKDIVRKGNFTYEQAKNIAKAGTVESIVFDSVNGAIIATYSFGISAALSFAVSIWRGESVEKALRVSAAVGLKVGGTTFLTAVLTSQLQKSFLNSTFKATSDTIISMIGPKASQVLVNALRTGKNIYGAAAMKSASKLLRGNVITAAASVVVLSSFDIINIFRGRISGAQLFKNLTNTTATVAGGTGGWVGGAAVGTMVGGPIGGVIGGLIGSYVGGSVSNEISSSILNEFIEDDAKEMAKILENVFVEMASEYIISEKEAELIAKDLGNNIDGDFLKDMYASDNREKFARRKLEPLFAAIVLKRPKIKLPSESDLCQGIRWGLESIADEEKDYISQTDGILNEELIAAIISAIIIYQKETEELVAIGVAAIKLYQEEFNIKILELAERGDGKGVFELGYEIEKDSLELAVKCYRIAGSLGYMPAFYKLDSLQNQDM